jgi:hypothetical protein
VNVGYAKLGRSLQLDLSKGDMAGNAEATNVLVRLARRNPSVTWYLVGKNNGVGDLPDNIINLWPPNVSKAPWLHGEQLYRCGFCKTPASSAVAWRLDCCDRARECLNLEDYVKAVMMRLDALVMHVGQHGVVHAPIPTVNKKWDEGDFATPYAWARNYGHYLIEGFNKFCDAQPNGGKGKVVWLCADPRNFFKARDIKWPTGATNDEPVLAQYEYSRDAKHERYLDLRSPAELGFKGEQLRDGQVWKVMHHYVHSGLEMAMLPEDWDTWGAKSWHERDEVGVATTAAYIPDRRMRRSAMIEDWVFSQFPDAHVFGKWNEKSLADVTGKVVENNPLDFPDLLGSYRTTIALPPTGTIANGMRWCTAKPYQVFAARSVCFMLPPTDAQGWIIPNTEQVDGSKQVEPGLWSMRDDWTQDELHLARWLRVRNAEDYGKRARAAQDEATWNWLVDTQRNLLERRWNEHRLETMIEERIGLR